MGGRNAQGRDNYYQSPARNQQQQNYGYYVQPGGRRPMARGNSRQPPMQQQTRIFVALFDYDPPTMSPNPDACDEELPFREGQLIKVRGDKDADGFYWGEVAGRSGYVPCNMVSEVQVDDERVAQELLKVSPHFIIGNVPDSFDLSRLFAAGIWSGRAEPFADAA